jgi:hypothetical protein
MNSVTTSVGHPYPTSSGSLFSLSAPATVHRIRAILSANLPASMRAGVYTNISGSPVNRLCVSPWVVLSAGTQQTVLMDVPDTALSAGSYWLMVEGSGATGMNWFFNMDMGIAGTSINRYEASLLDPLPPGSSQDNWSYPRIVWAELCP